MPQRVLCSGCHQKLYEGPELKPPEDIIALNKGNCPYCGKQIGLIPTNIEVRPAEEKEQEYTVPSRVTTKEQVTHAKFNFLDTARNGFNALIEKFGLYDVSLVIKKVNGRTIRPPLSSEIYSLRLSLDSGLYMAGVNHAIEINFKQGIVSYLERPNKENSSLEEVDPSSIPLEQRKEYQKVIMKKLQKLAEILSKHKEHA